MAAAIWDLVWAGLLTNDTLAPLRVALGGQQRRARPPPRARRARPRPGGPGGGTASAGPPCRPGADRRRSAAGGRCCRGGWRRRPPGGRPRRQTVRAHALALTLLERHGVLTRGAVASERIPGGFAAVYPVLRAMEEAGQCRAAISSRGWARPSSRCLVPWTGCGLWLAGRARLTRGLSLHCRPNGPWCSPPPTRLSRTGRRWPGRSGPGETPTSHRPGRKAGALVVLVDGSLVLYVERGGRTLLSWTDDPDLLAPSAAALAASVRDGALGRLTVERADGLTIAPAAGGQAPLAPALEAAGFRPTPRGLRLRAS